MKIYTRTGDDGTTGLFGGVRARKDAPRVEAYGTVDELNAVLGTAVAAAGSAAIGSVIAGLQADLFALGADLATPPGSKAKVRRFAPADAERLEELIDNAEAELLPLAAFILPTGTPRAAALHHARTICRRAERLVVPLMAEDEVGDAVLVYLNRLSDLLFVLARQENDEAGVGDTEWHPGA
jgi:cob(I)alamin adenosyltransferase